jgi:radical SAM protein with 4Fe4S-binding SPASM domain
LIKKNLKWELFIKICEQIKEFDTKIKAIHFHGWGEPLVNQELSRMIEYVKKQNFAEKTYLITNGSLFNKENILDIIDSGIDVIKISIQGLTSEDYLNVCGKKINIDDFIKNLSFLYNNRNGCKIFIKIADITLKRPDDKLIFYNLFEKYCDRIAVENIRPLKKIVGFENMINRDSTSVTMYNWIHKPIHVCSLPFYMLQISSSGDIIPCCSHLDPTKFGNIENRSLLEVWNSNERKKFLQMMLTKKRKEQNIYPICKNCEIPDMTIRPEDELDSFTLKLEKSL